MKQLTLVSVALLLAITACGKKESASNASMEKAAPAAAAPAAPATTEAAPAATEGAPMAGMEHKEEDKKPEEKTEMPAK